MLTYDDILLLSYSFEESLVKKDDFSSWRIRFADSPDKIELMSLDMQGSKHVHYYSLNDINENFLVSEKILHECKKNLPKCWVVYRCLNGKYLEPYLMIYYMTPYSIALATSIVLTMESDGEAVSLKSITLSEYLVLSKYLSKI